MNIGVFLKVLHQSTAERIVNLCYDFEAQAPI